MKKIRYILEYIIFRTTITIVRILPHSFLFKLSNILGKLLFIIPPLRKLTICNVQSAFPEESHDKVKKIACGSLINLVQSFFEFAWFAEDNTRLNKHFDGPLNLNELAKEKAKGNKGLIYVVPHIGNWELAGLIFSNMCEQQCAAVARKLDNPYLNKLLIKNRSTQGSRIIPAKGAVKGMMKALKDGCVIATLIDQNTRVRDGGIWTNFMGLQVPASRAPAMFARKRQCEVAVGGCVRVGQKYLTFAEELPKKISEYESDQEIIDDIMAVTENIVRKYPEQYLWFYKRFQHIHESVSDDEQKKYPYYSEKVKPRFYSTKTPKDKNVF